MAETATTEAYDLEKELQVILDRIEDAQKADLFCKFLVEEILPPIMEHWREKYLGVEPRLVNHLAMQQRFAAMDEIQRALEVRAARVQQDSDEAAQLLQDLRQARGGQPWEGSDSE